MDDSFWNVHLFLTFLRDVPGSLTSLTVIFIAFALAFAAALVLMRVVQMNVAFAPASKTFGETGGVAICADVASQNLYSFISSSDCFLQRDGDFLIYVLASLWLDPGPLSEVLVILVKRLGVLVLSLCRVLLVLMAIKLFLVVLEVKAVVVYLLLPGVAECLVCLVYPDKKFDGFRVGVGVGVIFLGQLVVLLFDSLQRAAGLET